MLWPRGAWGGWCGDGYERVSWDLAAVLPLVFETDGTPLVLYRFGAVFITKFYFL